MRADYQKYFEQVKEKLLSMGAKLISEEELKAEFSLQNNWIFVMNCEKYYAPAFSFIVTNKDHGKFDLRILMEVFCTIQGIDMIVPSIENQLSFLEKECCIFFENPNDYKIKYNDLNKKIL